MTLAILTKYNLGLPLLPVLLLVAAGAWKRGQPELAVRLGLIVAIASILWMAFLILQTDGWQSFTEFARNRANSLDSTPLDRLEWYFEAWIHRYSANAIEGWAVLLLGGLALLRWREVQVQLLAAYWVVSMMALSLHPYLLDRNIAGVALATILLAAIGASTGLRWIEDLLGRRAHLLATAGAIALAFASVATAFPASRAELDRAYRRGSEGLAPASDFVQHHLQSAASCRVIGTFDAFSPGWVRILYRRIPPPRRPALTVGIPYPLERSRVGLDASPQPIYLELARRLPRPKAPLRILTLDVLDGSIFDNDDYSRWGAWKRNLVVAIRNSPDARLIDELRLEPEGVVVQAIALGNPPLHYLEGWGAAEPWGRWTTGEVARLGIPAARSPRRMHLEYSAYEGLEEGQECRVWVDGRELHRFGVSGQQWRWEHGSFVIPPSADEREQILEFRFLHRDPGRPSDPRSRSLPFRSLILSTERSATAGSTRPWSPRRTRAGFRSSPNATDRDDPQ